MMRIQTKVKIDDFTTRYKVRIEDMDSAPGSDDVYRRQLSFLNELATQPYLLNCGPARFERLVMTHNGTCWVVEMEAVVDERP